MTVIEEIYTFHHSLPSIKDICLLFKGIKYTNHKERRITHW